MSKTVSITLLALLVLAYPLLSFSTAYSVTEGGIQKIKMIFESDKLHLIIVDDEGKRKEISVNPEEIQYHYGEVRISDRITLGKDGILFDGKKIDNDKLKWITIEKESNSKWKMKIRSYLGKYIRNSSNITYEKTISDRWKFSGNLIIDNGELIEGDAIAVLGDVEVYGKVKGDVVSVFGDVFLDSTAIVGGDVISVTGDIITNDDVEIDGESFPGILYQNYEPTIKLGEGKTAQLSFDLGYNRVAGLNPKLGVDFHDYTYQLPDIKIKGGYAFAAKYWQYDFRLKQQIFDRFALKFGGAFYQLYDNSDRWVIRNWENSMGAFLLKEDFWDIYRRKGFSAFIEQWIGYNNRLRLDYYADSYSIPRKNTNWSLFGGKKTFRENYSFWLPDSTAIKDSEGELRSMVFSYELNNLTPIEEPYSGWRIYLEYESAGNGLGGDFDFNRWWGIFQRLQPLNAKQHLNLRVAIGFSKDNLPIERQFCLGGIGTMRGYDYDKFRGNYAFLSNLEYNIEFPDLMTIIPFFDIGKAAYGRRNFRSEKLHSDIGMGFRFMDKLRINLAKPTDDPNSDLKITIRAEIPF